MECQSNQANKYCYGKIHYCTTCTKSVCLSHYRSEVNMCSSCQLKERLKKAYVATQYAVYCFEDD